jgi:negative regulator of sigma E activity
MLIFLMIGCGTKTPSSEVNSNKKQTSTKEVKEPKKAVKVKRMSLPEGFKETKKLRPLEPNVPVTCQEWSDGCNICTRAGNNQASCTIYTCENKGPFSCLKWQ